MWSVSLKLASIKVFDVQSQLNLLTAFLTPDLETNFKDWSNFFTEEVKLTLCARTAEAKTRENLLFLQVRQQVYSLRRTRSL